MNNDYMTISSIFPNPLYSSILNSQQMQQHTISMLQAQIREEQMKQCLYNQTQALNMRMVQMQNCIQASTYIPRINTDYQEEKDSPKALDEIIFPDDPIRDYCEKLVSEIENKYDKILKEFDRLIKKG